MPNIQDLRIPKNFSVLTDSGLQLEIERIADLLHDNNAAFVAALEAANFKEAKRLSGAYSELLIALTQARSVAQSRLELALFHQTPRSRQ